MSSTARFTALDVFRGMTVCFMIIVNVPGDYSTTYAPLLHAQWNGFTVTDLVFPSFLFAVGNAMSFATGKWSGMEQQEVLGKIIKRTMLIFLLGYLLHWIPELDESNHYELISFSTVRILGVLQRIALAYCLASLLIYYCKPKALLITCGLALLGYWGILLLFGEAGAELTMAGNAVRKLDLWLIGPRHMPDTGGIAFEAQGWLGTLPAMVNAVAGFFAGQFIRKKGKTYEGLAKLLLAGFTLFAIACIWDLGFPINKKLWTSSFVLYTVGLDCMIIACIIFVIDFLGKTKWTYFFEVFGKNPLFIYILSELGAHLVYGINISNGQPVSNWLMRHIFQHAGMYLGSLLFATCFMLLCWTVGWWMDMRKIYVRV